MAGLGRPLQRLWEDVRDNRAVYLIAAFVSVLLFLKIHDHLWGRDAHSFYRYLLSLVFDRDLNLMNQFDSVSAWGTVNLTPAGYIPDPRPPTVAIFWAPFFLASVAFIKLLGRLGMGVMSYDEFPRTSIFDPPMLLYGPHLIWVNFGVFLLGIGSLILMYRVCRRFFSRESSFIAVVAMLFSTMFYWQMILEPLSREVPALFTLSLFMYIWTSSKGDRYKWVALGLVGGWMLSLRPYLIPFVVLPGFALAQSFVKKEKDLKGVCGHLAAYGLSGLLGLLPLLIFWQTIYGSFLSDPMGARPPYAPPLWEFPMNPSVVLEQLFGLYRGRGLLPLAPIFVLSLAGFPVLIKRSRVVGSLLLLAVLYLIILCAGFTDLWVQWVNILPWMFFFYLPVFALSLAALLDSLGRWPLLPILAATSLWQWIQYIDKAYVYDFGTYERLFSFFLSYSYALGQGFLASQYPWFLMAILPSLALTYVLKRRGAIDRDFFLLANGGLVALILVSFLDWSSGAPSSGVYLLFKGIFVLLVFVTVRSAVSLLDSPWSGVKKYIVPALVVYQVAFVGLFVLAYFQSEFTKTDYARKGLYDPEAFPRHPLVVYGYVAAEPEKVRFFLDPSRGQYDLEKAKAFFLSGLLAFPGEPEYTPLLREFPAKAREEVLDKVWAAVTEPDEYLAKLFSREPRRLGSLALMFTQDGQRDRAISIWLRTLRADPAYGWAYNGILDLSAEGFPWEKLSDPGVEAFLVDQDRLLGIVKETARIRELVDLMETGGEGGAPNQLASSARRIGEYASGLAYGLEDPYIRRLGQELAESPGFLVGGSSPSAWSKAREKAYQIALLAYSALQKYPYSEETERLFSRMSQGQEIPLALSNGSFETWGKWYSIGPLFPKGWNTDVGPVDWVDYERVEAPVMAGRYALKLTPREKGRVRLYPMDLDKGVLAGKVVTFGMWVYTRSASVRLYIDYDNVEGTRFSQPNRRGTEGWQFLVVTSRIPKDVPYVRLVFSLDGGGREDWAVVDGAQLWVWE